VDNRCSEGKCSFEIEHRANSTKVADTRMHEGLCPVILCPWDYVRMIAYNCSNMNLRAIVLHSIMISAYLQYDF